MDYASGIYVRYGRYVREVGDDLFAREARHIGSRSLEAVGRSIASQDWESFERWVEDEGLPLLGA